MTAPLIVLGTRPEVIKLGPVATAFRKAGVTPRICATAQHRELLDQMLPIFDIKPDHDLDLMRPAQTLSDITAGVLEGVRRVIEAERPSVMIVQGDTTTTFAAALAGFYAKVPVAHVEAGLRTGRRYEPFPEEMNRILTSRLAEHLFAPTALARDNLLAEGVPASAIEVTGNTVVDALIQIDAATSQMARPPDVEERLGEALSSAAAQKLILVTCHRRESFGAPLREILGALLEIAAAAPDCTIVFPVHPNPQVREVVHRTLVASNILLTEPLPYRAMVWLLRRAHFVLTDSGGLQEEAPTFDRPVLVLRDTTERPEAVDSGNSRLVGTDRKRIVAAAREFLAEPKRSTSARGRNPYGDGSASTRIVSWLQARYST